MLAKTSINVVAEAEDATDTLTLTKKHKPDVVLLDAAIPGGDAFELVTKLAKSLPATKFVLLSVLDNPTYMARAQAAGALHFLLLGFSRREFVASRKNTAIRLSPSTF